MKLTDEDITRGIDRVAHKINLIAIFGQIMDGFFLDKKILVTKKTAPLAVIFSELSLHISGQLSRICFNKSKRYKTASILLLYKEISERRKVELEAGCKHAARFKAAGDTLCELERLYSDRLARIADRHYAHLEIMSLESIEADYREVEITLHDIKKIIEGSMKLLYEINLFWADTDIFFADDQHADYKRRFWNLIVLPDRNSMEYFT